MNTSLSPTAFRRSLVPGFGFAIALYPLVVIAVNKNVSIDLPESTATNVNTTLAMVGNVVNFQSATGWPEHISTWSWSPGSISIVGPNNDQLCNATKTYGGPTTEYVTATYNGETSYALKVIAIQMALKSIEFTSDHGVLLDNNTDWSDSGSPYAKPEWVASPARNNPISQTKNTTLYADVTVNVQPAGLNFSLFGNDGAHQSCYTFSTSAASSGADQVVPVNATLPMGDWIHMDSPYLYWEVSVSNKVSKAWPTGPHTIYCTYGQPGGSAVTEKRVADVCDAAVGQSTLDQCAAAISSHLHLFRYDLFTDDIWGPSPVWLLHAGSPYSSQCPGLALFMSKHFAMLGLDAGQIRFCQATNDGNYVASTTANWVFRSCINGQCGHPNPTFHADYDQWEPLVHIDGGGAYNAFEAAVLLNSKYYAAGIGVDGVFNSPKDVVTTAFTRIAWFYFYLNPQSLIGCEYEPWVGR